MKTIKRRIIATITSIFFASILIIGLFTYKSQTVQLEHSLKEMAKNENTLFRTILSADAEGLARAHEGLTRVESLTKPFAEKETERSCWQLRPLFLKSSKTHTGLPICIS